MRFPRLILPKHTDELELLTPESDDFSLEVQEFSLAAAAEALEVSPKFCRLSADVCVFLLYSGEDNGASLLLLAEKRGLGVGFSFAKSAVGTARWPPS